MTTPTSSSAGSSNGSGSTEHGNRYLAQVLGEQLSWPGAATTSCSMRGTGVARSAAARNGPSSLSAVPSSSSSGTPPGWVSTVQDLRSGAASGRCRDWRAAPQVPNPDPVDEKSRRRRVSGWGDTGRTVGPPTGGPRPGWGRRWGTVGGSVDCWDQLVGAVSTQTMGWKVWNVSDAPSLVLGSFFGYAPAVVVLLAL